MKVVLYSILFSIMVITSAYASALSPPPETVALQNKMGTVTFTHQSHQQLACQLCHHTGNSEKCSSCHGVSTEAPPSKNMFHALCKDCHSKSKVPPEKCKDCHVK